MRLTLSGKNDKMTVVIDCVQHQCSFSFIWIAKMIRDWTSEIRI